MEFSYVYFGSEATLHPSDSDLAIQFVDWCKWLVYVASLLAPKPHLLLFFSKKSPTGPTERTPKPEYLVSLAPYLGVRW